MVDFIIKHIEDKYNVIVNMYYYVDCIYHHQWIATAWSRDHLYVIEQQYCYGCKFIALLKLAKALKEKLQ